MRKKSYKELISEFLICEYFPNRHLIPGENFHSISEEQKNSLSSMDKIELIFHPGFSSKDEVTDVSGRGVGMDAVKSSIEELGGAVHIDTEIGRGTKISLNLPI